MTSAQSMQTSRLRLRARIARLALSATFACPILLCAGCSREPKLVEPVTLAAPYEHAQIWAVVPFANESGVSTVRVDRVADAFTEQAEQIDGVQAVPVNRVIATMRRIGMKSVTSANDALILMNALGVDGLIVGSVTTFDPFPPIKFGAAIQLFTREHDVRGGIDPVRESRAPSERVSLAQVGISNPVAQASGVFDATNHQTLMDLNQFAVGRTEPRSAYGKDAYLVSMDLYTQFVAYRLLHDLLDSERSRIAPAPPPDSQEQATAPASHSAGGKNSSR
jgi:hypothetical protein